MLVSATAALVVAAGWWVLTVQLVPSTARPYVGGSTDNTVLELALGYNGLNRILGRSHELSNWSGDGSGLAAFSGHAGLHRLFTAEMGNEIAWLLLVALFALAFGVYLAARRQLSRGELCALVIWGGWLVVTGVVLSFMSGVVHPYYTVSMAPSIAALIGMSGVWAWSHRARWDGRLALGGMVALSAASSAVLLHRNHFNLPWTALVVALAVVGVAGVLMAPPRMTAIAVAIGVLAGLAGTATYSVMTTATPHHGSIPTAIRTSSSHGGWMDDESDNTVLAELLAGTHTPWSAATNGSQSAAALEIASGTSVMAVGGWSGDPVPTLQDFIDDVHAGKVIVLRRGRTKAQRGCHSQRAQPQHLAHPRDRRLGRRALPRHHRRWVHGLPPGMSRPATMRTWTVPPRWIRQSRFPMFLVPMPARVGCPGASTSRCASGSSSTRRPSPTSPCAPRSPHC